MLLSEIAKEFQGVLIGKDAEILRLARLEDAEEGDLSFLAQSRYRNFALQTKATAILVTRNELPLPMPVIQVDDPHFVYRNLLPRFHPQLSEPTGIHPTAIVSHTAKLGENVVIGPFCYIADTTEIGDNTIIYSHVLIGREVKIGTNCRFYPMSVIRDRVIIGNQVIVKDGAVIGSDGFAFLPDQNGKYQPVPQLGTVEIGDNVSIGANTCIDRALSGATRIGNGVKLDNLIQVGHNVTISEDTVVAAQTGFGGSTKIGKRNLIGGQVGFGGHLTVTNDVKIGAQSGVISSIDKQNVLWGTPAMTHQTMLRIIALWKRLPEVFKRIDHLEKKVMGDTQTNDH